MRFSYAYLALAVAAVAAACDTKASNATKTDSGRMASSGTQELVPPPPGSPPSITLVCAPNSVRFSIDLWRYTVAKGADAMWRLPASAAGTADSIMINPRASEADKWPLEGPLPIVIKRGGESGRKPTPSLGSTPTPFNYTITAVCGSGTSDEYTVVIDPIMILPR